MGFDLLAAETVSSLKDQYPDMVLVAAVPYRYNMRSSLLIKRNTIMIFSTKRMKLSCLERAMLMIVFFGEMIICCVVPVT